MRPALAAALAVLALLPAAAVAQTQTQTPAPRASLVDIEDEVMCVTCKIPLNIAEGPQPDREREFIRGLIAQGKTKAQIKRALVVEYGDNVLALPDKGGLGLTAYLVPLALFVTLVAGLAMLVPRWRARTPAPETQAADAPALAPADAKRLDEDLARY
jgi:cytochrome c-type biogenesis protein CcmH/NrfF